MKVALAAVALAAAVALGGIVSRGAAVGAEPLAAAPAQASRDYWITEFRRRWRAERRNARARAAQVRALRRILTVRARRLDTIAGVWIALARCESGERWHYNGSSGFDGGLQFHPSTWAEFAPPGFPPFAWLATPAEQVEVARRVLNRQGWRAWPRCSRLLGLA